MLERINELDGALPATLTAVQALAAVVRQEHPGLEFDIADFGGMRTEAKTKLILGYRVTDWNKAVRADPTLPRRTSMEEWRKIAPWGSSPHNYGAAFDVIITRTPAGMSKLAALNIVKEYADVIGMKDGRDFNDPPHFELPGGLSAHKVAWQKATGTRIFLG